MKLTLFKSYKNKPSKSLTSQTWSQYLTPEQKENYDQLIKNRKPEKAWIEKSHRKLFSYQTMSPEEYIARNAFHIMCFGAWRHRHEDKNLDAWLLRVHEIFRVPGLVEQCQEEFCTPEEVQLMRKMAQEEF